MALYWKVLDAYAVAQLAEASASTSHDTNEPDTLAVHVSNRVHW